MRELRGVSGSVLCGADSNYGFRVQGFLGLGFMRNLFQLGTSIFAESGLPHRGA